LWTVCTVKWEPRATGRSPILSIEVASGFTQDVTSAAAASPIKLAWWGRRCDVDETRRSQRCSSITSAYGRIPKDLFRARSTFGLRIRDGNQAEVFPASHAGR
jgi:hypothetical protein